MLLFPSPTNATKGDTVTIRLILPVAIASVEFGGVPAASFTGGEFDATIKAVVGNGASERIKVVAAITSEMDSMAGFTFVPPVADVDVSLCGRPNNATLVSNLSGSNYQWQISSDGINYFFADGRYYLHRFFNSNVTIDQYTGFVQPL